MAGVNNTNELDSAKATAESLQPKGFTLSTTQVESYVLIIKISQFFLFLCYRGIVY